MDKGQSSINGVGKTRYVVAKEWPFGPIYHKQNITLNVWLDKKGFLEENTGKNYVTLILVVIFFDIAPKAQETKAKPYWTTPNKRLLQSKGN